MTLPTKADHHHQSPIDLNSSNFSLLVASHVIEQEAEEGSSNIAISPLSLDLLLNQIADRSKGLTLQQLLSVLRAKSPSYLNLIPFEKGSVSTSSTINGGQDLIQFNTLLNKGLGFNPFYVDIVTHFPRAYIKRHKADQIIAETNAWIEEKSRGLIKTLLPPGGLNCVDQDKALILANAMYFKAKWDQSFDASNTITKDFHLLNGETIQVPFMNGDRHRRYRYGSFDGYKILKLPNQIGQGQANPSTQFAMYIILPKERYGLQGIVQMFKADPEYFNKQYYLPKEKISQLWLPKFKLSYQVEASNTMKELGLNLPFEDRNEVARTGQDCPLYVQKMFHKSVIEVNEEDGIGAETDSDSIADLSQVECLRYPVPSFVADHPFMFMIKEEKSGVVFFIGAVVNPMLDS